MNLSISNSSALPLYKQIFDQISSSVIRGELTAGSLLPPIRSVAAELRVSVISVKRAWEELERSGFINTAVGRGCFVAELTDEQIDLLRRRLISERLADDIEYCVSLNADLDEIVSVIANITKEQQND